MRRKRKGKALFGVKSKKGNAVLDGITILVVVVVLGLSSLFASYLMDTTNTDIQTDPDLSSEAQAVTGNLNSVMPSLMDNAFLFAFILFTLFVVVSVFMIDTHPVFFVFSVILLIGVFIVGGLLANAYDDVASDSDLASYANNLTYTAWVMKHLLELIIGIGFLTLIALFAKFKAG